MYNLSLPNLFCHGHSSGLVVQDLRNAVKETKKKEDTLYQLSCRKCSGQNFLGNTDEDLRDKTMEHFSV